MSSGRPRLAFSTTILFSHAWTQAGTEKVDEKNYPSTHVKCSRKIADRSVRNVWYQFMCMLCMHLGSASRCFCGRRGESVFGLVGSSISKRHDEKLGCGELSVRHQKFEKTNNDGLTNLLVKTRQNSIIRQSPRNTYRIWFEVRGNFEKMDVVGVYSQVTNKVCHNLDEK